MSKGGKSFLPTSLIRSDAKDNAQPEQKANNSSKLKDSAESSFSTKSETESENKPGRPISALPSALTQSDQTPVRSGFSILPPSLSHHPSLSGLSHESNSSPRDSPTPTHHSESDSPSSTRHLPTSFFHASKNTFLKFDSDLDRKLERYLHLFHSDKRDDLVIALII